MNIAYLIEKLSQRLPELEWKMLMLGESISSHALPRGLFHYAFDYRPSACLAEIKADMKALSLQDNYQSALYLSERIHQKISVLVALCHAKSKEGRSEGKTAFGIKAISTRQRWLQDLEQEIVRLEGQQDALQRRLRQIEPSKTEAILGLNAELGLLEKQLTLAKEKLAQSLL